MRHIWIEKLILLTTFIATVKSEKLIEDKLECPAECICEKAPLRTAPFVLNWMASWGEDSLPEVHKNDILNSDMMVHSGTAKDANVDVEKVVLHVTCSMHSSTNTSNLLPSIPTKTEVLTLLQAPGCSFTIIDGGQLIHLNSLIGLHIQGYAYEDKKQVSGFAPNKVTEVVSHQKFLNDAGNTDSVKIKELTLAFAEDALKTLIELQLIDLQYVKLVASKDIRRLRRYSMDPISSRTLLDLPLPDFLDVARGIEDFYLPPYLDEYESLYEYDNDINSIEANIFPIDLNFELDLDRKIDIKEELMGGKSLETVSNYFNSENVNNIIPYMIFRANFKRKLAPFTNLKNLKYLRIAHGKLEKIGQELFTGLDKLHTLTLEHNFIQIIPEDIFIPVPNLRHLSLAYNKILTVDFKSLRGLSKLLTLDLDYNQIQVIGPTSFPILPSLKTIRATGNPIIQIFPDAFVSVNNTEVIYLGSKSIPMDIHDDSFRSIPSLNTLVLQNVSKATLKSNLFSGMPQIKHLTIHGQIAEIMFDAFSKISLLKELDLSNCNLERLSMDAFIGLKNLKKLDLSHNDLSEIAPGTFDYLTSLKELYLNQNRLATLPLGIFLPISAKLIRLENNPWHCTCNLLQLRPSITNKVKRPGLVVCRWSDKLVTVCKKTRDRLIYDARVAPLCAAPEKLRGTDVYHAALRHIKCSKYHWDPKLLLMQESHSKSSKVTKMNVKNNKIVKLDEKSKQNRGWIPLTDHTPAPIQQKDLLAIAEMEELSEVEPLPGNGSLPINNTTSSENNPQNDAPNSFKNKHSSNYISKNYIKERKLINLLLVNKSLKQRETEKKKMKRDYKHKMYQKAKLKAYIKNKQRKYYRIKNPNNNFD